MIGKKINRVHLLVVIILLALITIITFGILFNESKEIAIAQNFMKKLEKIHAINTDEKVSDMKFKSIESRARIDQNIGHTINCDKYGININKESKIIGFSKKETKHGNSINITEIEAIDIAKKYLSNITKEKFEFKEVRTIEGQDLPYYNIVFSKFKNQYIILDKEIVMQIDKYTGELDGYSNSYLEEGSVLVSKINISEDKVIDNIKDYLQKVDGEILESKIDGIGYVNISDKVYGLSYIVDIKLKMRDDKISNVKFRVNAENGQIVNVIK